jgi:SSS family solute:Na+ symporter
MPLYSVTMPLMFIVGFTAILVLPGLGNGNLSVLTIVRHTFPAWILGIIGGAGALTAMVPAAILILTAATLFVKNFCRSLLAPAMSDSEVARWAKTTVLVITAVALFFAIYSSTSLVALLLLGYTGVTQFFPGVVLGLYSRRVTAPGVFAGLATGVAIVAFLTLTNRDPFMGLNAGFLGLSANFAITAVVSLFTHRALQPFSVGNPASTQPFHPPSIDSTFL